MEENFVYGLNLSYQLIDCSGFTVGKYPDTGSSDQESGDMDFTSSKLSLMSGSLLFCLQGFIYGPTE